MGIRRSSSESLDEMHGMDGSLLLMTVLQAIEEIVSELAHCSGARTGAYFHEVNAIPPPPSAVEMIPQVSPPCITLSVRWCSMQTGGRDV